MNISAEEKNRYLREAEVVLAREGFLTDRIRTGGLRVLLDGLPLCEVPESGGVTCRMEDASTPEKVIVTTPGADNKKELRGHKRV